jgi:hypothetical protein
LRWNLVQTQGGEEPDYETIVRPSADRVGEIDATLAQQNVAALERIMALLPPAAATALRDNFNRRAFPAVYADAAAVSRHLAKSLALEDLDAAQRERIEELAASYRPAYTTLSRRLVELSTHRRPWGMEFDAGEWKEHNARRLQGEKVRFERDELNYRAINRLRSILDEEQVRRIGGLPRPDRIDS